MHHAILALGIAALHAVAFPSGVFHEFLEGVVVPLLQQVARLLPSEDVEGGTAPRSALKVALTHEELKKERAHVELPALLAIGKNHLKELIGLAATKKTILIGGLVVGVSRADHHAFNTKFHHLVKEPAHRSRIGGLKERGVGGDAETHLHCQADSFKRLLECSFATHRKVMVLFLAVHVNTETQVLAWLEQPGFQLLL